MNILQILLIFLTFGLPVARPAAARPATAGMEKNAGPVVSGSLASDEILLALLTDEQNKKIVLSPMADNPAWSSIHATAAKIPGRWHNSAESLVALKPSLVILASFNNPTLKARLAQLKVPVLELKSFDRLEDIRENISAIGKAINRPTETKVLLKDFDQKIELFTKKIPVSKPRPLLLSYSSSATPGGNNTLINDMITRAGGTNLAATAGVSGWSKINAEIMATFQPDFIIVADGEKPRSELTAQISSDPLWKNMTAVKNKKYIFVNQTWLLSVSHHILNAIDQIQGQIFGPVDAN